MENYIQIGGGCIKNKTRMGDQTYVETARNILKIGIIRDSYVEKLNKIHFN